MLPRHMDIPNYWPILLTQWPKTHKLHKPNSDVLVIQEEKEYSAIIGQNQTTKFPVIN